MKDVLKYVAKIVATVAVCALGAAAEYCSEGKTGVGWAVLGVLIIWLDDIIYC